MKNWENALVTSATTIREAIQVIDDAGMQIALVVDPDRNLVGTLSDGDIRRGLLRGLQLTDKIESCVHHQPTTARAADSKEFILSIMRRSGLHQVPIVDEKGRLVGLETLDNFVVAKSRDNWVVVMVGGLGSRLRELTANTPKPMLHVGSKPLLETILRSYINQGFKRFYLAVNYKAEIIENHFGDGSFLGAEIRYIRETKRMGTAGALSLLPEVPDEPILVTNGDLLVQMNYADMLDKHLSSGAMATMAVREYEFQVPYGVIQERNGKIHRVEEKPIHRSLVSAGIYVLSPQVLNLVPEDTFYDMPSLFDVLIAQDSLAQCYKVQGYWLDIGRMDDYTKAQNDFPGMFE